MIAQVKHITILLVSVLASGCDPRSSLPAAPADQPVATTQHIDRAADRLDVLEAVFRHQFDENASAAQRNVDYFFLSLDDRVDPPAELLARFANEVPKVLPVSFSKASAMEGVAHEDLGGRGLIFRIATIAWLDEDAAEVEGGYYEGGLSASGNTYRVMRTDGVWKVTEDRMNWIS